MKLSQRKTSISLLAVQEAASEPVYRRGVQYYRRKKVLKYEESANGDHIEALVIGSEPQPYKVVVTLPLVTNLRPSVPALILKSCASTQLLFF